MKKIPAIVRFFEKVVQADNGCWIWMGADKGDYGKFKDERKLWNAHKWAFVHLRRKEVPPKHELGHTCRNPGCVNPWHLRPMTRRENVLDSDKTLPVVRARKVVCLRGHALSGDNLYIAKNGGRNCRACHTLLHKRREQQLSVETGG